MSPQLNKVGEVLKDFQFNILSINEIQYDLPNVPNREYRDKGKNLRKLLHHIRPMENENYWNQTFHQANTGNDAKTTKKGNYFPSFKFKNVLKYADPLNFGIFPGQYSTGLIYNFPKVSTVVIKNLKWRTFHPKAKLSTFKTAAGRPLSKNIQLFDKNFTDTVIKVGNKEVHLIALHTVPSFHFGNKFTPNYERNADQLRFLEWYLTGSTDIKVGRYVGINPLPKNALWIAMGDFNTDIKADNPGSAILKSLIKKTNLWVKDPSSTHEGDGYVTKRFKATLDYIFFSKGLDLVDGGIYRPEENRLFLGCKAGTKEMVKITKGRKLVSFYDKEKKKRCFITVNEEFHVLKQASDHFPLWANFNIK